MALITLKQLLDHAADHQYGLPAFNINNMEQGLSILRAANTVDAPVIIQASRGARSYAGDIMLSHMVKALSEMYPSTFPNTQTIFLFKYEIEIAQANLALIFLFFQFLSFLFSSL